jgi:PAS domain-containing protein
LTRGTLCRYRTAAIDELADQRRFDQAVLEVLNSAVLACDADGAIVVRNAAHRRLVGGEKTDPRPNLRYQDGTPVPLNRVPLRRALAGEEVTDLPLRIVSGDRPVRPTSPTSRPRCATHWPAPGCPPRCRRSS